MYGQNVNITTCDGTYGTNICLVQFTEQMFHKRLEQQRIHDGNDICMEWNQRMSWFLIFLQWNGIFKYVRDSLSLQGTAYNVTGNILGYQQLQDYPGGYVL